MTFKKNDIKPNMSKNQCLQQYHKLLTAYETLREKSKKMEQDNQDVIKALSEVAELKKHSQENADMIVLKAQEQADKLLLKANEKIQFDRDSFNLEVENQEKLLKEKESEIYIKHDKVIEQAKQEAIKIIEYAENQANILCEENLNALNDFQAQFEMLKSDAKLFYDKFKELSSIGQKVENLDQFKWLESSLNNKETDDVDLMLRYPKINLETLPKTVVKKLKETLK